MNKRGPIYEFLAMAAVIALCAAISAGCHIKYTRMARDANALDIGLGYVQSICDRLAGSRGDMPELRSAYGAAADSGFLLCFDDDFEPAGSGAAAYFIQACEPERDGLLGTVMVRLFRSDGKVLFETSASWQEG